MNDYAKTIRQQLQEAENAAMEELEQRGAPFLWACIFAMVIAAGIGLWNGYQKHIAIEEEYAQLSARYAELDRQNSMFLLCLNGQPIGLGDAVLRCRIKPQEPGERL